MAAQTTENALDLASNAYETWRALLLANGLIES